MRHTYKLYDIMKKSYKLCRYPKDGFGSKGGTFYLLDQFGNRFEIQDEMDPILNERFYTIDLDGRTFWGNDIADLVDKIRDCFIKVAKW